MQEWKLKEIKREVDHLIGMAMEYIRSAEKLFEDAEHMPTIGPNSLCPHCGNRIWVIDLERPRLHTCMNCKRRLWIIGGI
jgi:DNA-directed RNA polymerase subunit RPC12/RpoP